MVEKKETYVVNQGEPLESADNSPVDEVESGVENILSRISGSVESTYTIVHDPMNGCPGDFAEDGDRALTALIIEAYSLGVTEEEIAQAIESGYVSGQEIMEGSFGW
jgi:hypothetical protein